VLFEVLGGISLGCVQLVGDQLDHRLDLGVFLKVAQEDKLDVFVALQTLRLLVPDVELENLLNVPFNALTVRVLQVGLYHDGKKRTEVINCLLHADVVYE